jgi:predicted phosphate transport protein (TIGR00153 family)
MARARQVRQILATRGGGDSIRGSCASQGRGLVMGGLFAVFGKSPFEPLVDHSRKVHECVKLVRPIADAILAGDMDDLNELQHEMSKTEYEADQLKDQIRQTLPPRYFLPVNREDVARFLAQMDRVADDAQDFAIVATFRRLDLPQAFHGDFLALVDKVVQVSESLLALAEKLALLQKESFVGPDAADVLRRIQEVAHMEWESDKLSRKFARTYFAVSDLDAVTVILLDKLCRALGGIANHAENVGKNLRLMITHK